MTFSQNLHEHLLLYVILLVEDSTVLKQQKYPDFGATLLIHVNRLDIFAIITSLEQDYYFFNAARDDFSYMLK